jgi:hypothetical protein
MESTERPTVAIAIERANGEIRKSGGDMSASPAGGKPVQEIEITLKATLQLDENWASNQTTEEMVEHLRARLNNSLGFRGQIKKLRLVSR